MLLFNINFDTFGAWMLFAIFFTAFLTWLVCDWQKRNAEKEMTDDQVSDEVFKIIWATVLDNFSRHKKLMELINKEKAASYREGWGNRDKVEIEALEMMTNGEHSDESCEGK